MGQLRETGSEWQRDGMRVGLGNDCRSDLKLGPLPVYDSGTDVNI